MRFSLILIFAFLVMFVQIDNTEALWGAAGKAIVNVGRRIGGSGKPMQHFKLAPNRKAAENMARNAGKGNRPVQHPAHKPGQSPHFHPADHYGNIIKDGSHYGYPKKG